MVSNSQGGEVCDFVGWTDSYELVLLSSVFP